LLPALAAMGHQVTATTRSPATTGLLRALRAEPVAVDGLDGGAIGEAVARAQPEVVIHQMTSLAGGASLRRFDRSFAATNRLRTIGTDHLLAAAAAAGVMAAVPGAGSGHECAASSADMARAARGRRGGYLDDDQIRGSSNVKAKRALGWQPGWPSWREGFRQLTADAKPVRQGGNT
jgi:nucleoside-diphosphate-sugar epimerase